MPPFALITGASIGIGYELARECARNGYGLILVARSKENLEKAADNIRKVADAPITIIPADLTTSNAPREIYDAIKQENIPVEILVNNAGFGTYGYFAETDLATELNMIQLNVTALVHLTKLFLPDMISRRRGKIMNVGSLAGFFPGPLMSIYYATKAFVQSFSEALANEVQGTGVSVTALCPGPTETGFQNRASASVMKFTQAKVLRMDAARVAKIGFEGLMQGKSMVIPGFRHKLIPFLPRLLPRAWMTKVIRWAQEKRIP